MNNYPRFMVCDALPSEVKDFPLEYVLDNQYGILWGFNDAGNGSVVVWLSDPVKDGQLLAEAAREAGEWLVKYRNEEEFYE